MNISGISRTPQMHALPKYTQSVTKAVSDPNLQKSLVPPSEKSDYSESDALLNQYMKQYQIDCNIYDGSTSQTDTTVRLVLPSQIAPDELEAFRQKLIKEAGSKDIDWRGVSNDFNQMNVGFDNAQNLNSKIDYISSRYAILKDRIETDFTGDEKEMQLGKLEELFNTAKQSIADTFANSIGGFYNDFTGENKSDDMKKSLLSGIDGRVKEYQDYLTENGNRVAADDWLLKDDGFMAARLREHMANANSKSETNLKSTEMPESEYSLQDLGVAGIFAKESMRQYNTVVSTILPEDELTIGLDLALQSMKTDYMIHQTGIGDKMAALLENTSEKYMNKYLDKLDTSLKNIAEISPLNKSKLDRDAIYGVFNYTKGQYRASGDISEAFQMGVQFAQRQFSDDSKYIGNYGDKYKWNNFASDGQYGNNIISEPSTLEKYQIIIRRFEDSFKSGNLQNVNLFFSHGGLSSADRYDEATINTSI